MNRLIAICMISGWLGTANELGAQTDSLTYSSRIVSLKLEEGTFDQKSKFNVFHRAFFCRLEDKGERASPLSLKFRLGTVDYVDQMEYSHLLGRID